MNHRKRRKINSLSFNKQDILDKETDSTFENGLFCVMKVVKEGRSNHQYFIFNILCSSKWYVSWNALELIVSVVKEGRSIIITQIYNKLDRVRLFVK